MVEGKTACLVSCQRGPKSVYKSVQEPLGHASLAMTMKYSHPAPDRRLRAIQTPDSVYQSDTITDTVENSGNGRSG